MFSKALVEMIISLNQFPVYNFRYNLHGTISELDEHLMFFKSDVLSVLF